jgi:hypothetical protein
MQGLIDAHLIGAQIWSRMSMRRWPISPCGAWSRRIISWPTSRCPTARVVYDHNKETDDLAAAAE